MSIQTKIRKTAIQLLNEDGCYSNATTLAEDVANEMKCPQWLDDENHIIWDIALEEFDKYIERVE